LVTVHWTEEELTQAKQLVASACAYCGTTENLTLDHVLPLSRGGAHRIENLVAACKPCNSRKGARDELEFRALLALEAFIDGRRGGVGRTRRRTESPGRVADRDIAMSVSATGASRGETRGGWLAAVG